jgi:uncharacterized protein DUF4416
MKPSEPEDANLVVSLFTGRKALFAEAIESLVKKFGPTELLSEARDFNTGYYTEESGAGLRRKIVSFERLVPMSGLAEIKLFTNGLEDAFVKDGRRLINIDPGYLTLERFVLASCKNFPHRIYLGGGVFADLTLVYSENDWRTLEWTYPDYRDCGMMALLKEIRKRYAAKIKRGLRLD